MTSPKLFIPLVALIFSLTQPVFSQTGPGGVGNATGASGQPQNVLWLRAESGVTQSGTVDSWADQSGNSLLATGSGGTKPSFVASDANFNNQPVIDFAATGTNKHLVVADNDILDNTTGFSLFVVFRTNLTAGNYALLSKRTTVGVDQSYMTWVNAGQLSSRAAGNTINGGTINNTTSYIGSTIFNGSSSTVANFLNGTSAASGAAPTSIANNASNLYVGAFDVSGGETRNLDGRIGEVLVYTSTLNAAQRQIVENYLASKYSLTISGDVFTGDASGFDFDVAGIGRSAGASHTEASSAGLVLSTYNGSLDTDGEFLLVGRGAASNSVVDCACAGYPGSIEQRWARTWFVDKTTAGSLDVAIAFDFGDGIGGQFPQDKDDYELLFSSDGGTNFSVVSIASGDKSIVGDKMVFRVANASLLDGIYTIGTTDAVASPINGAANRTWYSYQTGNANDPLVWTLDGGITPLYVNPSSETPGASDNVVITSGKTITLTADNFSVNTLEVYGTLDLVQFSGHTATSISGTGRIRLAGSSSNLDNFITAPTTAFADASTGGTVEIYGTSTFSLDQTREYNDLIINKTSGVVSVNANYTLNGDLTINSGEFRFGTVASDFSVYGNIQVNGGTTLSVANANIRHQLNVYGNFTNNGGTANFTNRVTTAYTTEATNGIVDFNLLNDTQNQTITCNGITRFYRIEIDKGTDDTYLATFTANAAGNFLLYGYANDNDGSVAQLTSSNNSFALLRGTAEIRSNVSIPVLSNNGNYNISAGAMLWVNGGTVLKNNGNSTVPYGKLKVSSGLFESKVSAGITTRDNGTIIVEGGVVNTNQIRTSVLGASNVGGYVQTGGAVTVDGGGPGGTGLDYYVFSLTYPGNVFQMSGGTLTVKGYRAGTASTRGAIFINSDPANVSVTGGTVIAEISNSNINDPGNLPAHDSSAYVITSRAPFWNLVLRNTLASTIIRQVDLLGGTSGPAGGGADEITLPAQNLVIKGGLTIESKVKLDHNGKNIFLAGNLIIQDKADLLFSNNATRRNTTTLDGTDNATLSFLNRNDANGEQRFWNLVINKPLDKVVSLASSKTDLTGSNNNLLRIDGNAFKLLSGTVDQGFHSIRMYCDTVLNYQTLGVYNGAVTDDGTIANDRNDMIKFRDDNTATTLLTTSSSVFGVVRLNSGDDPITLRSNVYIKFLQYLYGKIDLGSYNLKIDQIVGGLTNPTQLPPRGTEADSLGLQTRRYSVEDMLVTTGANSDGGLSLYVAAGTANGTRFVFPLGIGTTADDGANTPGTDKYTPAYVTVSNVTDDGYITINPVNAALDLLNGYPTNMLQYYWNVKHSGFTTVPNVLLQFIYNDADDNSGVVTNYVPGRVLNFSTREADAGGAAAVRESLRQIDFTTGPLTTGLYTAAEPVTFTGSIQVFYNRENGEVGWNNDTKWSLIGFNGTATTDQPGPGDVVRLRNNDGSANNNSWVTMDVSTTVAAVIFDNTGGGWLPRITIDNTRTVSLGIVEGSGEIMVEMNGGVSPIINDTDLGDFSDQTTSNFIYKVQDNDTYSAYTNFPIYPNLRIEGSGGTVGNRLLRNTIPITVNRDLRIDQGGTFLVEEDVTILRDINLSGGGNQGSLEFGQNGSHFVQVGERILIQAGANNAIRVRNTVPSTLIHTMAVGGNIEKADGTFDLYNGTGTANNAILELNGTVNGAYTNTGGVIPDLFRVVMNKSNSIASTFTFTDNFVLNGVTNTATKAIELQNGLLIFNDAAINVNLSTGGGDFSIPSTAGLEVRSGTVNLTGSDTGLLLDGYLLVSGGTVNIDDAVGNGNNFIEYSASGSATLQITSGTLTVGSQIRRGLTSTAGVLKYRQSGGAVVVGRRTAPTTSRGVFEVVNNGSEFTHSGGTLTLVRGINSTTVPSLLLEPQTPALDINIGSSIIIGDANTPAGVNGQNIGIKSNKRLANLSIVNTSGSSPRALIYSSPLTINNQLTIASGSTFDAQGLGMTIRGNMIVNGTFVPNGNTVTFGPPAARSISGTGIITFYNLTKDRFSSATLNVLTSIEVLNDLRVENGSVADNGNTLNLRGNAYFGFAPSTSGSHVSTVGGQGLVFAGSTQQQINCLRTDGTATLGTITIDNPAGVVIPDNADKVTIATELRLSRGVLDIGGSLLTLSSSATIEEVNTFGVTNMVQTNSSFTDNGMTKNFPAGSTTDFIFPIGQLLYTPITFDFADIGPGTGAGTTSPSITVRPANERQPIIVNDVEVEPCFGQVGEINDLNNVLQYHWIITATNTTNLESNVTIQYQQSLVALANGLTEADYIAARVRTSDNTVFKFPDAAAVDEAANTINFSLNNVSGSDISGEYLAGVDCAIPNNIIVYTTKGGGLGTGNVLDPTIYVGDPSPLTLSGASIQIAAGDVVTFPSATDNVILYRTEIQGTVDIKSGSIGHRFGTVVGTGTLSFEVNAPDLSAVLPAGFYNDFFSCSGGGLQYAGNTNYEVLGGINSLRRLVLTGTGNRILGNNDIIICEDLTINGPSLLNINNRDVVVQRDLIVSSGSYSTGTGALQVDRDILISGGTFDGETDGTKTIANDLVITSGTFTAGSGGTLTILGDLLYSGGTFSGGSGTHRTIFEGTSAQATSGVLAFNQLEINNTNGLTLGGATTVTSELLLTDGNITPSAGAFTLASTGVVTPTGGQVSSFVNGKFHKVMAASSSFIFPIGKGSVWRYASVINPSPSTATWDFEYFIGNADTNETSVTNMTPTGGAVRLATGEYWKVSDGSVAATGRTATVGLSWGIESDVNASSVERQDLVVMRWGGTNWVNHGGTNFSSGNTQSRGSFNSSSTVSFSEQIVTLGSTDASNPLPVELISFAGVNQNGFNKLDWKTASELNNDYFELQRSSAGEEFSAVAKIQGKGTTNDLTAYTFVDEQPYAGKNYYRLKQVDFNGNFEYSNIILVTNDVEDVFNISVFPNPASKEASITIRTMKGDEYEATVHITDMTGRALTSYVIYGEGSFEQQVDVSTWGEVGIYLVEMRQGSKRVFKRLMLN